MKVHGVFVLFTSLVKFLCYTRQVLDATSDEPWGPHGSDMADIARATKNM